MGRYSLKDGKITAKESEAKQLTIKDTDNEGDMAEFYIKIYPMAKTADPAYLYLGSAGQLCLSSTAPTGTSGSFTNIGTTVGWTA